MINDEAFRLLDLLHNSGKRTEWIDGKDSPTLHLALFDPWLRPFGDWVPACRFVGGEQYVELDMPKHTSSKPYCGACMEVSLQHGLSRV